MKQIQSIESVVEEMVHQLIPVEYMENEEEVERVTNIVRNLLTQRDQAIKEALLERFKNFDREESKPWSKEDDVAVECVKLFRDIINQTLTNHDNT